MTIYLVLLWDLYYDVWKILEKDIRKNSDNDESEGEDKTQSKMDGRHDEMNVLKLFHAAFLTTKRRISLIKVDMSSLIKISQYVFTEKPG